MKLALKPYGATAILAHDLGEAERRGLFKALPQGLPDGCVEYVWGDTTLCFIFRQATPVAQLADWIAGIDVAEAEAGNRRIHQVPVIYDGPDLEAVAAQLGWSTATVVARHAAPIYTVRMMGFTPGFPYLEGLDESLHLPRKATPRPRIEPGAVAIGGPHAGIYSVASPGGWHLLGRTPEPLFDPLAAQGSAPDPCAVFRFAPGDRLRFLPFTR